MEKPGSLIDKVHSMAKLRSTTSGPTHTDKVQGTTRIAISKSESDWNSAAIWLAVQHEKLPSQRSGSLRLRLVPARHGPALKKISINDWNVLALARQKSKLNP